MGEFIFIGGTGRSGTTVLSKVLGTHQQFRRLPFELRFHIDPNGFYDLYNNLCNDWDVYRGSTAASLFEKFYTKLLGFSLNSYHHITLQGKPKSYYRKLLTDFFLDLGISQEKRLWIGNSPFHSKLVSFLGGRFASIAYPKFYLTQQIEKEEFFTKANIFFKNIFATELSRFDFLVEHTPYNFLYFDFLNKVFPRSKFIHIKRNPFDVISSYSNQNWGSKEINKNARQVINLYKIWEEKKSCLDNYIEVSLENLGENPQTTLTELSQYLGTDISYFNTEAINSNKIHFNRWKENENYFKELDLFDELKQCAENLGYDI